MRIQLPLFLLLALSAAAQNCVTALGEDAPESEQARAKEAAQLTTESAKNYVIKLSSDGNAKCELHPSSILKWSNPVAGSIHGNVFLWTHEKRPVAVGSFYQWFSPWTHMSHEFHLLAETTITATYRDDEIWAPTETGLRFKALRNASAPRDTPASRLIQMRRIAREFTCTKVVEKNNKLQQRQMRLLSQPVYRYSSANIKDGAIFVFVQGTDPEVWLLFETVETAGRLGWRFAAARMNTTEFTLQRNGETVWQAEPMLNRETHNPDGPYFKVNADQLPGN